MKSDQTIPWCTKLARDGFCIIPDLLPPSVLCSLSNDLADAFASTPFGQGHFYGFRTKRFGSLLKRSSHAADLVMEPTILALAEAVLGSACDTIQLNVAQAIAVHPGERQQFPHRDHDMWPGLKGPHEYLLNVIWPLDQFTEHNGATRIYPGSHRVLSADHSCLSDPVSAACTPGSAICFLGSTLHGAGANTSQDIRRAVVIGYSLGWLKPYENLWLAYPPEIARNFPPELAALAGYAQHRPNLGNFEGQCPSVLLRCEPSVPLGAIDALRPDQASMIAAFAQSQVTHP